MIAPSTWMAARTPGVGALGSLAVNGGLVVAVTQPEAGLTVIVAGTGLLSIG